MKVLVVAPHGDDEVLGCGGSIAKHTKDGDEVYVLYLTKPYMPKWSKEYIKNRYDEIEKVKDTLNVTKNLLLDYKTTHLYENIIMLNESIYDCVNNIKPDIMYIPFYGDVHIDHRIAYESCLVAIRPIEHKVKQVMMYETLSETEWGKEPFIPNVYVDISKYLMKKIIAMHCYDSELKSNPHPRSVSGITSLARKRGSEVNVPYAEAFVLVRETI